MSAEDKRLLAALKGGAVTAALCEQLGQHLAPLLASAAGAKRKAAAKTSGPFLLQGAMAVGRALGQKGLGGEVHAALLGAAEHLLGGLMAIAPHAKCPQPLQLEKLAKGLAQKLLDAQRYAAARPHVDALLARLAELQGEPSPADRTRAQAVVRRLPAHARHGGGRCTSCLEFVPRAGSDAAMCALALGCLQARAVCAEDQQPGAHEACTCACCACVVWLDHAETLDAPLSRSSRGSLVRVLHQASARQVEGGDRTAVPFLQYVTAVDVIILAGSRPENVGLRICVDQMAKIAASAATEARETLLADGYERAVACIIGTDAAQVGWAVADCLRLVEQYSRLCGQEEANRADEMWKQLIVWCEPRRCSPRGRDNTPAPVNTLIHAASILHLGLSRFRQGSPDTETELQRAADVMRDAQELCFGLERAGSSSGQGGESDALPLEYNAMLQMVLRGGVLIKAKDVALSIAQLATGTGSRAVTGGTLLALEALMVCIAGLISKAQELERKAKVPLKFGSLQLIQVRLAALRAASVARMEYGLRGNAAKPSKSKTQKGTKKPKKSDDAKRACIEEALAHLQNASSIVRTMEPFNSELMRSVASFSYNAGIRLSNCECFEQTIQALTLSCEQLQECCSSSGDINEALCARYSLLAKTKDKMQDISANFVESLQEVVLQVAASLPTDPSADRDFLAPLIFQHTSVFLKLADSTDAPTKGTKKKGKAAAEKKSKAAPIATATLTDFLFGAGKKISRSQLGVILEEYMVALGSVGARLKVPTRDMRLATIETLLSVYDEAGDNVLQLLGRARSLLHRARFLRTEGKLDAAAESAADATELLVTMEDKVKPESAEQRYLLEHTAIVYAWHGTLCVEQQGIQSSSEPAMAATAKTSFKAATVAFSELIVGGNSTFCDVEEVWSSVQMLSDYFRLMSDYAMELHFLRLRYRIVSDVTSRATSQCESSVQASDCVTILAEMSTLHTRHGFSEQGVAVAEVALSDHYKGGDCNSEDRQRVDAQVRSAKAFGMCRSAVHSDCISVAQEQLSTSKAQRGRAWSAVGASCHYILAEAWWLEGDQLGAVQAAIEALQVRVSLVPGCQGLMAKHENSACKQPAAVQSIHDGEDTEVLAVATSDSSDEDQDSKSKTASFSSAASSWNALHNLLESLVQTGYYSACSGRGTEGEYYLHAAHNVAERLCADGWKARIQYTLTELHYRRDHDDCTQQIDTLLPMCASHTLEYVRALAISAACIRKSGDTGAAISKCMEGLEVLESMRHPKFLKERLYAVTTGEKEYSIVDDSDIAAAVCGRAVQLTKDDGAASTKDCLFPYQLEQAQASLELKQGRAYVSKGEDDEAQKLYKRALRRATDDSPLSAIIMYHICCQHALSCTSEEETVDHLWSLHVAPTTKPKARKGRGRKAKDDSVANVSAHFREARDHCERALHIACTHNMAGLTTKLCHRLAAMDGRNNPESSCRMLQASLCVPLCSHMQSLIDASIEQRDALSTRAIRKTFCMKRLVGTPATRVEFQEHYIDKLSPEWTVCSCTVEYTQDGRAAALFVTRMVCGRKPVVLRIPMEEETDNGGCNRLLVATEQWEQLIKRNIESLHADVAVDESSKTTKNATLSAAQKSVWWERRTTLDHDMKTFLQGVEHSWLGGFKGMMLGQSSSLDDSDLTDKANELKKQAFDDCEIDPTLIELVLSSVDTLDDQELEQACTDLIVGRVGSSREEQPQNVVTKAQSAAAALRDAFIELHDGSAPERCNRGPTIMLLGPEVQQLPWESMPCLRNSGQSATRMPCLPFVLARHDQPSGSDRLWHIDPGVQPDRTFYVLNPGGDLTKTQETFEEAFSKPSRIAWEGMAGTPPTSDQYKSGLQSKDLFIYCGHSTGERYLRGSELAKLNRCAVTMLMGCSSGKLRAAGDFGVEGMPLSYLLAGCPALVANLWDVTDKDIDKFSTTLLESWVDGKGAKDDGEIVARSLPEELPEARQACKFLYLNGAAPVCYGVPCVPVAASG